MRRYSCAQVPLYERGYEKDPAKVAFEAAKAAQRSGIDVLLVDTAGRMQARGGAGWLPCRGGLLPAAQLCSA